MAPIISKCHQIMCELSYNKYPPIVKFRGLCAYIKIREVCDYEKKKKK